MANQSGQNNAQLSGANITGVSADDAQQAVAQSMAGAGGAAATSALGGTTAASSALGGAAATSSIGGTTAASSTGVGYGDAKQQNAQSMGKAGQMPQG